MNRALCLGELAWGPACVVSLLSEREGNDRPGVSCVLLNTEARLGDLQVSRAVPLWKMHASSVAGVGEIVITHTVSKQGSVVLSGLSSLC